MIVCMKMVSYGYDAELQDIAIPPRLLDYFGYIFSPGCVIFGPFIPFSDYLQVMQGFPVDISWFISVCVAFLVSMATLCWSTCGIMSIEHHGIDNRWMTAFTEAMAFRFSHYFVSYSSEMSCLLMGAGTLKDPLLLTRKQEKEDRDKWKADTKEHDIVQWTRPVSRLLHVELPRSLVDVVTNWNLPMHYWLKTYVFKSCRYLGVLPAILLTYTASSLLHGLNFQLSAVLLSIGIFAYLEYSIRDTLADLFNACIGARTCKENCSHHYKKARLVVMMTNFGFSLVAMWNLAYLGCLFDNSADEQDQGYSMGHALGKWARLGYACHVVMFIAFIIANVIKFLTPSTKQKAGRDETINKSKKTL